MDERDIQVCFICGDAETFHRSPTIEKSWAPQPLMPHAWPADRFKVGFWPHAAAFARPPAVLVIALQRSQDALEDARGIDWTSSKPIKNVMPDTGKSNHLNALCLLCARDVLAFDFLGYDQVVRTAHHKESSAESLEGVKSR